VAEAVIHFQANALPMLVVHALPVPDINAVLQGPYAFQPVGNVRIANGDFPRDQWPDSCSLPIDLYSIFDLAGMFDLTLGDSGVVLSLGPMFVRQELTTNDGSAGKRMRLNETDRKSVV
jgi:hypothetical protein